MRDDRHHSGKASPRNGASLTSSVARWLTTKKGRDLCRRIAAQLDWEASAVRWRFDAAGRLQVRFTVGGCEFEVAFPDDFPTEPAAMRWRPAADRSWRAAQSVEPPANALTEAARAFAFLEHAVAAVVAGDDSRRSDGSLSPLSASARAPTNHVDYCPTSPPGLAIRKPETTESGGAISQEPTRTAPKRRRGRRLGVETVVVERVALAEGPTPDEPPPASPPRASGVRAK